ncbi:MAG TPA: glucose 1-dehydrogenase [Planctomycetota bacterium]|nr:glucose 1-dehydrogenase [Planctomycetota bacterium]
MRAVGVSIANREVRLIDHPEPALLRPDEVKLRILEVGVCGTDREICEFKFGEPPAGSQHLVLGHEALGEVVEVGPAVKGLQPGGLVVPMVRLPCADASCSACVAGRQDFCLTDSFPEHGIRRCHGFMTERIVEREKFLVPVGPDLRSVAVLVEPLTILDKALREVEQIQRRMPWSPGLGGRALVLGAGAVGLLGAMVFRQRGCDTTVVARSPGTTTNAALARSFGAKYVSSRETSLQDLGPFDVIYEAAGSPATAFESLATLAPNGVCILTGVPAAGEPIQFDGGRILRNIVLQNQLILGTVNAGRESFSGAIALLGDLNRRWPESLKGMITGRHPLETFGKLLFGRPDGIKNILVL